MKILVAYATNSSGTLIASQVVANILKEKGHELTHRDIRNVKPESLENFDLVIFGSPSWNYNKMEGQPHEFFTTFIQSMTGKKTPGKKYAIFGLGDTAYMYFCGAVDYLEEFVHDLQGELVIPSLRIDGFFFQQSTNEKNLREWAEQISQLLSRDIPSNQHISA